MSPLPSHPCPDLNVSPKSRVCARFAPNVGPARSARCPRAPWRRGAHGRTVAAVETGRLEAFSDGVFAIAITLLILEVHVSGQAGASLARQLAQAWPSYTGYVISFVTIGIMWANHHSMFRLIDRWTHGLVVANLLLLLCVSFVPFPTKVLAEHLPVGGHDQRTAVLFFSGTYVVIAVFYNVLWRVAVTNHRLISPVF